MEHKFIFMSSIDELCDMLAFALVIFRFAQWLV